MSAIVELQREPEGVRPQGDTCACVCQILVSKCRNNMKGQLNLIVTLIGHSRINTFYYNLQIDIDQIKK